MATLARVDWVWWIPPAYREAYQAGALTDETVPLLELKRAHSGDAWRPFGAAMLGADAVPKRVETREWFLRHVRGVRNLALDDGTPIASAEDLWQLGVEEEALEQAFFLDLLTAIWNLGRLDEGLKKTLRAPPGSLGSAPSSDGIAAGAAPAVYMLPATATESLTATS
jgi:hypothetical protein